MYIAACRTFETSPTRKVAADQRFLLPGRALLECHFALVWTGALTPGPSCLRSHCHCRSLVFRVVPQGRFDTGGKGKRFIVVPSTANFTPVPSYGFQGVLGIDTPTRRQATEVSRRTVRKGRRTLIGLVGKIYYTALIIPLVLGWAGGGWIANLPPSTERPASGRYCRVVSSAYTVNKSGLFEGLAAGVEEPEGCRYH